MIENQAENTYDIKLAKNLVCQGKAKGESEFCTTENQAENKFENKLAENLVCQRNSKFQTENLLENQIENKFEYKTEIKCCTEKPANKTQEKIMG